MVKSTPWNTSLASETAAIDKNRKFDLKTAQKERRTSFPALESHKKIVDQ